MGDSDKRYPVLDTPKAWQEYLVLLGMEAWNAAGQPGSRDTYQAALRERMAQAAQTIVIELELAKETP